MKKYFITGTGTGIGKTFLVQNLCESLTRQGKSVNALKPVITGFSKAESDSRVLMDSNRIPYNEKNLDKISPWRFVAAVSPDIAARKEGQKIDFAKVVKFCRSAFSSYDDFLFIEGIGGVMTPLNNEKTVADLVHELQIPALLVGGTYLGAITHLLTAVKMLENIHAVIINESSEAPCATAETLKTIENFTRKPVFFLPRGGDEKAMDKILDFLY